MKNQFALSQQITKMLFFAVRTTVCMLVFIINLLCSPMVLAEASFSPQETIEYSVKEFAAQEWGKHASIENSMTYMDFNGLPFATGFYFIDHQNNKPLGTIVMSNLSDTPPLIEVVYGYSLHGAAINALKQQKSHVPDLRIVKIIYYPFLPPIVQYEEGSSAPSLFVNGKTVDINNIDLNLNMMGDELLSKKPYPSKESTPQYFDSSKKNKMSAAAPIDKKLEVHEINVRGNWRGCTPAAAANIFGYYDDNGLNFLTSGNSQTATKADINILLKEASTALKTTAFKWKKDAAGNEICEGNAGGGSTNLDDICQGLVSLAKNHGYEVKCKENLSPTFGAVKGALTKNTPVMLSGDGSICDSLPNDTLKEICYLIFPPSIYHQHSTVAIGFSDNVLSDAVLLHDSWPASSACGSEGKDKPKKINWNWFLWFGGDRPFAMHTVTPILYGAIGCPSAAPALFFELPFTPNGELINTKLIGYDYDGDPIYFKVKGSHDKDTGNTILNFLMYRDSSHNTHIRTDRCKAVLADQDPAFSDEACELIKDTTADCRPLWTEMDWNSDSASAKYWSNTINPTKSLFSIPRRTQ